MNRILKTDAVVLRVYPHSRSSNIVDWLLEDGLRLTTMIKGACRPKSLFLGQYDLFYTCELLYYAKEYSGIHIARECTPLKMRSAFRSNWRATACAGYLSDLLYRALMRGASHPGLFEGWNSCLDMLAAGKAFSQITAWMELKVLEHAGIHPHLENCASCTARTPSGRRPVVFSVSAGGVLCANCIQKAGGALLHISPEVCRILHSWQAASTARAAVNTKCTTQQVLAFEQILGRFIEYHLDIGPYSRRVAISAIHQHRENAA